MEMQALMPMCDFFVLCSGRSPLHVKAIAEEVEMRMEEQGSRAHHIEGLSDGQWVLMDFLNVVLHIFTPEARQHYALERLWADAPREEVEDPAASQGPAGETERAE